MIKKEPYKKTQPVLKNPDRVCEECGQDYKAVAPLQKTCSDKCRKAKNNANSKRFHEKHNGEKHKEYNKTRTNGEPGYWATKARKERLAIINTLGGKCKACNHNNPLHLHIDYIPTMIGTGFRHPRHKKWVMDHIKDFRLLCANHHYELTTTGKIEGTDITQKTRYDK